MNFNNKKRALEENLSDSDDDQKKKFKNDHVQTQPSSYNHADKFKRMLEKQGYKEGKGLGKNEQGIVKPIEESNQKGKRGIGFEKKVEKTEEWDFTQEEVCF
jgi:hypothetical protein